MEIKSIYTNTYHKRKRYFMYVDTPLFSILQISQKTYFLLRMNAERAGWEIIKCKGGNEKLRTK